MHMGEPRRPIGAVSTQAFRVGLDNPMWLIVLVISACMAGIALKYPEQRNTCLLLSSLLFAALMLMLFAMRLEIGISKFRYQQLHVVHDVAYRNISRAFIEVEYYLKAPQGAAFFWVQLRDGQRIKLLVKMFPLRAVALLVSRLEANGIPLEVEDAWAARVMADAIRKGQAKAARRGTTVS